MLIKRLQKSTDETNRQIKNGSTEPFRHEFDKLVVVVTVAAAVGDSLGYEIGRRWGRARFHPDARVLRTQYLDRADLFLARYGGRSIVLARFVPIVRTFLPPVVGMSSMRDRASELGGTLRAGPTRTGGHVEAFLPVG